MLGALARLKFRFESWVVQHTAAMARTLAPYDEVLQKDLVLRGRIILLPRAASETEVRLCSSVMYV